MQENKVSGTRPCPSGSTVARILALLLIICLVECATGSCLSYGHSCWGAHGKRSGARTAANSPDLYLNRMLRRMAANAEMSHARQTANNDDINTIFQVELPEDALANRIGTDNDGDSVELTARNPEAIPMLDDNLISKMKIWQIMKDSSDDK